MARPIDAWRIATTKVDGGDGADRPAGNGNWWSCAGCINGDCCALLPSLSSESPGTKQTRQHRNFFTTPAESDSYTKFAGIPEQVGIAYAVNGVCHQIANRLLYQTGQIVSRAPGYWLSASTFGTYGTRVGPTGWLASSGIASAVAMSVASDWQSRVRMGRRIIGAGQAAPTGGLNRQAALVRRIRALYTDSDIAPSKAGQTLSLELHAKELDLIFEYRLGSETGPKQLAALSDLYREYLSQKPFTDRTSSNGVFDPTGVAKAMNRLVSSLSADVANLLGDRLFERLYGLPAHHEIVLISPNILASVDSLVEA